MRINKKNKLARNDNTKQLTIFICWVFFKIFCGAFCQACIPTFPTFLKLNIYLIPPTCSTAPSPWRRLRTTSPSSRPSLMRSDNGNLFFKPIISHEKRIFLKACRGGRRWKRRRRGRRRRRDAPFPCRFVDAGGGSRSGSITTEMMRKIHGQTVENVIIFIGACSCTMIIHTEFGEYS